MDEVTLKIKLVDGGKAPEKKTEGAAAFDCYARLNDKWSSQYLAAGQRRGVKIPLGFKMELPQGYHAELVVRSSTATKTNFRCANSVGVVDADFRGEVCAILDHISEDIEIIHDGDRICQMLIVKDPTVKMEVVDMLSETERGEGGFGSTGVK